MPTFAEYLEKWLKQSTTQGLTNPLTGYGFNVVLGSAKNPTPTPPKAK